MDSCFLKTTRFGNTLSTGNLSIYVFPLENVFSLIHPTIKSTNCLVWQVLYTWSKPVFSISFTTALLPLHIPTECVQSLFTAQSMGWLLSVSVHNIPLFRMSFASHLYAQETGLLNFTAYFKTLVLSLVFRLLF